MDKYLSYSVSLLVAFMLLGCVTKNYENDNATPVVQNESTNNEIAMTRISLGLGYLKMGNTTQAKLNLEKAKRFAPHLVPVHTAFAHYFDSVGEPEQAITSYEKALSINADDPDTLNNYGVFLCKQASYEKAEKQILKAISQPSYLLVSQSYENLALCQLKAGKFDKAELFLEKSIQHSPNSASSLLHMIRLQYAKGDFKKSHFYLKRYEKAARRFSASALALAYKVFEKLGDRNTAKNYASMLIKMFPNSFEAKQFLLNGLREIEADLLAKKYLDTLDIKQSSQSKKRVVVLSPHKKNAQANTAKLNKKITKNESTLAIPDDDAPKLMVDNKEKHVKSNVINEELPIAPVNHLDEMTKEDKMTGLAQTPVKSTKFKALAQKNIESKGEVVAPQTHTVVRGDNLFSISKKYNIRMTTLERWNDIDRNKILKLGDVVKITAPKAAIISEEQ